MSKLFYNCVTALGRHVLWMSSRCTVVNRDATARPGGFILAGTHTSPYDVALMMRHSRRHIDFVSIVELFRIPAVRFLFSNMHAFPLDRSKPDSPTVRTIVSRLEAGRVIGMFPEGSVRPMEKSVVFTGRMRPGIGRLAKIANVPIVPCVMIGSTNFGHPTAWLPIRRTRYAIAFADAIPPEGEAEEIERRLIESFMATHRMLSEKTPHLAPHPPGETK